LSSNNRKKECGVLIVGTVKSVAVIEEELRLAARLFCCSLARRPS